MDSDPTVLYVPGCFKEELDYPRNDLNNGLEDAVMSAVECHQLCLKHPDCVVFSWNDFTAPGPSYFLFVIQ